MLDSNEHYELSGSSTLSELSKENATTSEKPAHQRFLHQLTNKKPRVDIVPKAMMPQNLWSVNAGIKHISKFFHGHNINRSISLGIVAVAL
jgi:hypothetical protein